MSDYTMSDYTVTENPENGRGCGPDRTEEAPYACCGLSSKGYPLEHFLIDPPIAMKWQRGAEIVEINDIHHLVIYVSKEDYPSGWDFLEESRNFGASRKISENLQLELLTPGESLIIFVHARAIPKFDFTLNIAGRVAGHPMYGCKVNLKKHPMPWEVKRGFHSEEAVLTLANGKKQPATCTVSLKDLSALLHPEDAQVAVQDPNGKQRTLINMPSFTYSVPTPASPLATDPDLNHFSNSRWASGAFLALPLTHFEFKNKANKEASDKVQAAGFDLHVLDY